MIALLFLAIGALFSWMVYRAYVSGEIEARGWGFSTRIHDRDSEPIKYWVTFGSYLVCAGLATVVGILMAIKQASPR